MRSPWHAGEKRLQAQVGVGARMEVVGQKVIRDYMPDQHRAFYQRLPFIVAGSVDAAGRPWATVIEGPEGFISAPDPQRLVIDADFPSNDPATSGLVTGSAIGLLGIELHTRRRNRLNGLIRWVDTGRLEVKVEQSFGNCPQYIRRRTHSRVEAPSQGRQDAVALDAMTRAMIENADTFFVASYVDLDHAQRCVDVSHRGGRPGFVKVQADRLTIPDYAGNLHFNTLGNLCLNPVAGLLFIDFTTGDVLHVFGRTEVILDSPLISAFEGAERIWTLDVEQVVLRRAAVSLRWSVGDTPPVSV